MKKKINILHLFCVLIACFQTAFAEVNGSDTQVSILSCAPRADDPTILDVVYKVISSKPTIDVRVLAFKDGLRSLENVLRPETFVGGTSTNIGDKISANVEHTISWKVSDDWEEELADVSIDILAKTGDLMDLHFVRIPALGDKPAMEVTVSEITPDAVKNALYWRYADHDPELEVNNGVMIWKSEGYVVLVCDTFYYSSIPNQYRRQINLDRNFDGIEERLSCLLAAEKYIYQCLGYAIATREELAYAATLSRDVKLQSLDANFTVRHYMYEYNDANQPFQLTGIKR